MSDLLRYIPKDVIREYEVKAIASQMGYVIKATSEFESRLNRASAAGADISGIEYMRLCEECSNILQGLYGLGERVRAFKDDDPQWGGY